MDKKSNILFRILALIYLIIAFLYITFIVQPSLYFHNAQAPFLLSPDFWSPYFKYPGGFSELMSNFFMQSFYYKLLGPIVLFSFAIAIMWLTFRLMNIIYKSKLNIIWSLTPFSLTIILANNYNFPFSVIISILIVLLTLLLFAKKGRILIPKLIYYTIGAVVVYYLLGSGYMLLFSLAALIFSSKLKLWESLIVLAFILTFSLLFPLLAYHFIFPIPLEHKYFYVYAPKLYFMDYEPTAIFFIYLLLVPILISLASILAPFKDKLEQNGRTFKLKTYIGFILMLTLAYFSHNISFQGDEKKLVASDYYSFNNNVEKTAEAARNMKKYSFEANINYNLAISKAGKLTEDFFNFFQIKGTDALHPDNEFLSERSFIAAEFYYDLGYISEARHWAYEALVFYPYSPRVMQILVKIHLVTGEYKAAEQYLKILSKGIINRKFIDEYSQYIKDPSLIKNNAEITEKRSFIPAERELSPFIYERFQGLLEANKENKTAYEYLMLYYLLDSQLENFLDLYKDAGRYFAKTVDIYEEALLMYGAATKTDVESEYEISPSNIARFNKFTQTLSQYQGNERMARNALYKEFGKSYMYYLQFLYPRIIKPEIIKQDEY